MYPWICAADGEAEQRNKWICKHQKGFWSGLKKEGGEMYERSGEHLLCRTVWAMTGTKPTEPNTQSKTRARKQKHKWKGENTAFCFPTIPLTENKQQTQINSSLQSSGGLTKLSVECCEKNPNGDGLLRSFFPNSLILLLKKKWPSF